MTEQQPTNPFAANIQPTPQPRVIKSGGVSLFGDSWKARLIFLILGLVILVEGFIVYKSFTNKAPTSVAGIPGSNSAQEVLPLSVGPLGGAKIALIADKKDFKVGETIPVTVRVFTGGYISDGVDLVLKYDPKVIEATSSSILSGNAFQNYPLKTVDNLQGMVKISAISSVSGDGFNGSGNFATINFNAKNVGSSEVTVSFVSGSTGDSNVIKQNDATDILESVVNATINITPQGGVSKASACGARGYQSCVDAKGQTGSYWCSAIEDSSSCQVGCYKQQSGTELGCNVISN